MGAIRDGLDEIESIRVIPERNTTLTPRVLEAMRKIEELFGVQIEDTKQKGELANILCNFALDALYDTKVAKDIVYTAALIDGLGWLDNPERVRRG